MQKTKRVEFRVEEEIKKEFYELCKDPSSEFRKFMINYIKKAKGKTIVSTPSPTLPQEEKTYPIEFENKYFMWQKANPKSTITKDELYQSWLKKNN